MRIAVVGSINTDLVVRVARFPGPGETVYGQRFDTYAGGKGANQAAAAARLGAVVSMLGATGDDAYSDERLRDLSDAGVDTRTTMRRNGTPGGIAVIQVDDAGENQIVVVPGANGTIEASDVTKALPDLLQQGDLMLAQLELPLDSVRAALSTAREIGARTIVNTAPIVEGAGELLSLVDILVVNEVEAGQLLNRGAVSADEAAAAGNELIRLGPNIVFTTLGGSGAVISEDGRAESFASPSVEVVDTTGAGDATVGAFAAALAEGKDTIEAARYAVFAGSFAVQRPGAQPSQPTRKELEQFIADHGSQGDS